MNIAPISLMTEQDALVALREYKAHRDVYDKRDWEIERIYRAISKGKVVISVNDAIVKAGMDEKGRPRLAVCEAHGLACICTAKRDELVFGIDDGKRWSEGVGRIRVPFKNPGGWVDRYRARVPRIPPQHRPIAAHLSKYHILWEADWEAIPRDPYLLKRIGKDAWVVLAAWDLTEVEVSVLRAHQSSKGGAA